MSLTFEWDPAKATSNRRKHGVSFREATTVFRDTLAVTVATPTQSATKAPWVELGMSQFGRLLARLFARWHGVSPRLEGEEVVVHARVVLGVCFVVSLLESSAVASPTSIGVFFDRDATDCDFTASPFVPFNVFLSVTLGTDAAGGGVLGADFRVDGLADVQWSVTPSPDAEFVLGNATNGGAVISFPACMTGSGTQRNVLLFTVVCLPLGSVSARTVAVEPRLGACGPCWTGPWATLCDAPVFTKILVSKGRALINNGACTVGVRAETWTQVKSLYRG